jgi:arylsulfatase A-like enzyme
MTPRSCAGRLGPGRTALALLASLALVLPALAQEEHGRPNIIFLFADDHGAQAISAYGSRLLSTPGIDRLAREGMLFERCLVTNSICAPSRAVILTGRYSHLNGVIDNALPFDGTQVTFPRLLQASGYETAIIGKWHLKSRPAGFDHYEVLPGQGHYYNPDFLTPDGRVRREGHSTSLITERSLDWLRERDSGDRPFLLMCQFKAPHRNWMPAPEHLGAFRDRDLPEPATLFDDGSGRASPASRQKMTIARHLTPTYDLSSVLPPAEGQGDAGWWRGSFGRMTPAQRKAWEDAFREENAELAAAGLEGEALVRWKYQRYVKNYLRCILGVDQAVGRLLEHLDRSGLAENTIVIYSSDQGWFLGEHGWYDKRWMYEESLRTPLLVRWPRVVRPGSRSSRIVSNLDLAPTLLEATGLAVPSEMQGASLLPLLRGEPVEDWREDFYYHYYEYPGPHAVRRHCGVSTARYKLIHYYEEGEWELFDLHRDPDELRSVYGDERYAEVREEMRGRLARLQRELGEDAPHAARSELQERFLRERAARIPSRWAWKQGEAPEELEVWGSPLAAGAVVRLAEGGEAGVVLAQGGSRNGWSLVIADGRPRWTLRRSGVRDTLRAPEPLPAGEQVPVVGRLTAGGRMELWVAGRRVAAKEAGLIPWNPREPLSFRADRGAQVLAGKWPSRAPFEITAAAVHLGTLEEEGLRRWRRSEPPRQDR